MPSFHIFLGCDPYDKRPKFWDYAAFYPLGNLWVASLTAFTKMDKL